VLLPELPVELPPVELPLLSAPPFEPVPELALEPPLEPLPKLGLLLVLGDAALLLALEP